MYYIEVFNKYNVPFQVEQFESPIYVKWLPSDGRMLSCKEEEAQGIVSEDGNSIYLFEGCHPNGQIDNYFKFISKEEYEYYKENLFDAEDENPIIDENLDIKQDEILTRAELTAQIATLRAQVAQLESIIDAGV